MNLEKENTVTIDPTTGLPELPEGYFWEVAPYEHTIYGGLGKLKEVRGYQIAICTSQTTVKTYEKQHWWSEEVTVREETTLRVATKRLLDPKKVERADAEYLGGLERVHFIGARDYYYSRVHYELITPEIVKAAAVELYTEWQAEIETEREDKAKKDASDALVGIYPPKVLA